MTWNYDKLFIGGKWVSGTANKTITVINPATEEVIGQVPDSSVADARAAIVAARKAFDEGPWPYMKPKERGAILRRMADILKSREKTLREIIVAEAGATGPAVDLVHCAASIDIGYFNADRAQDLVHWVESSPPTGGPGGMAGSAIVREPVGVVGAITPFNFPFMLNMTKVFPAMAVGCSVVLKPHPWTPLDAFEIAKAAEEAELPPGVLNLITGHGDVGDAITGDIDVDMVTFTGSTATGRRIMSRAGNQIKRVQLELGGKSAKVFLDDVSEDVAREIGFDSVLLQCGQGCALPTRLLMPEHLMDAYLEGVEAVKDSIVIGDPRDPATVLGPLISEQQRDRVESYVKSGLEQGARLITGGKRPAHLDKGFFFEPTIFVGSNDMRIAQEEIFGPVLTVIPYSGKDEDAIRIANDSTYGLAGFVIATNTARAFNVARQIRAGHMMATGVGQALSGNLGRGAGQGPGWGEPLVGVGQSGAFGGFKQSGIGREWGHHGLEDFTEVKSIIWS